MKSVHKLTECDHVILENTAQYIMRNYLLMWALNFGWTIEHFYVRSIFEIVGFINRKGSSAAFEGLGNKHPFIGLSITIWVAGKHYIYNLYTVKKILI